jgi:hypothetical protein
MWKCAHRGCEYQFWASEMRTRADHWDPYAWFAPCGHNQSAHAPQAIAPNTYRDPARESDELRGLTIPVEYHDSEDPSDEELFGRPVVMMAYDARPDSAEAFVADWRVLCFWVVGIIACLVLAGVAFGTLLAWAWGWIG